MKSKSFYQRRIEEILNVIAQSDPNDSFETLQEIKVQLNKLEEDAEKNTSLSTPEKIDIGVKIAMW